MLEALMAALQSTVVRAKRDVAITDLLHVMEANAMVL
jgi:hypothetical protein